MNKIIDCPALDCRLSKYGSIGLDCRLDWIGLATLLGTMRKEDLKFILNMLVMLCNDDRTHF